MAREMKDSGIEWIGEIPKDWEMKRLKSCILDRTAGSWGENEKGNKNDYICIRIADFDFEKLKIKDSSNYEYTKRNYNDETIKKLLLKNNDILIEKSGGGEKTPVGRTILYQNKFPALYANFIERLRVNNFIITPKFMHFGLVAFYKNKYILNYIKQTTGIQNLDIGAMLSGEKLAIPDLQEQEKIANYLDKKVADIDLIIEKTKATIEDYKKYKQSIITEAVTKGLNSNVEMKDSGIEWIGEIPKHWEVTKLKNITNLSRGIFGHRPRNDPKYYNGDYPFIQTGDVASANKYIKYFSQTLSELGKSVSKEFKKGTIAFTLAANVGDVAILDFDSYFPDSVMAIIPKNKVSNIYLYYILSVMKKEFFRVAIVSTQLNLNVERVGNIYISFPKLEEQQQIAEYLDKKVSKIDNLIAKKESLISEMEEYKKSLIYECVTGKKEIV